MLALEIEPVLVLDIEHYCITASVSHLTCPLPPHQSVIWLALYHCITTLASHLTCPHHHISQSFDLPPATNQSVIWLAHCHHISQSFDLPSTTALPHWPVIWLAPTTTSVNHLTCPLPPIRQSFDLPTATTSVSHLTCPLPLHYHIGQSFDLPPPPHQSIIWLAPCHQSVSHLTCPLPPHQSVIWLALYHCITTLASHLTCPHYHISQSFDLPPATNQAVIWLAHCHHISQSFDLPSTTALPHWPVIWLAPTTTSVNHLTCPLQPIRQSFDLPTATTSVSHLTCPLPLHYHISQSFDLPPPPHQSIIWLVPCHRSGSHLTCPLPPHHYVPTTPSTSSSTSTSFMLALALALGS